MCTEHYEVDIQWSILNFFFEIAQNPIANFSKLTKKTFIVNSTEMKAIEDGDDEFKNKELMELLKEDVWSTISYEDNPLSVSFLNFGLNCIFCKLYL